MHYRNGREAKNGDKIVKLSIEGGKVESFGVLHSAVPGNDYCNGNIASVQLDKRDLEQIETLIKNHKPESHWGAGLVTVLFLLFLQGCFKGCGY